MSRRVIRPFRRSSKGMLCVMQTASFELFFSDDCEGVHWNFLQRLKPRCLFEIGLRPSWGQRSTTLIDPMSSGEVNTEQLMPGRPQLCPGAHVPKKPWRTETRSNACISSQPRRGSSLSKWHRYGELSSKVMSLAKVAEYTEMFIIIED